MGKGHMVVVVEEGGVDLLGRTQLEIVDVGAVAARIEDRVAVVAELLVVLRALRPGHVELAVGVVDGAVVGAGLVVVEFGRLLALQTTSASIADLQVTCECDEQHKNFSQVLCRVPFFF